MNDLGLFVIAYLLGALNFLMSPMIEDSLRTHLSKSSFSEEGMWLFLLLLTLIWPFFSGWVIFDGYRENFENWSR